MSGRAGQRPRRRAGPSPAASSRAVWSGDQSHRLAGLVATHGAQRLGLDVLASDEAVLLLARILGEERVAAEPQATAEVAEVCGFLPLALRIAAANLLDQPQHSIADYVARLRAGNRLAELAVDGDPQAAVGGAFDASYATLDPQAQRLFPVARSGPGPEVTAPAAAALTVMQVPRPQQVLDRLAARTSRTARTRPVRLSRPCCACTPVAHRGRGQRTRGRRRWAAAGLGSAHRRCGRRAGCCIRPWCGRRSLR